ncbi:Unknown protein [Striga hermonthica]|uniref:Uncharacterized protein n=1 Tax=Striga hermonthica TaxID=68872 RepID=A0A9N7P0K0_STRHE|nr:Unknown protein [Striga hermonthica]
MVRAKVHRLRTLYRDFVVYLSIPGVMVHDDGGLVSVNQSYWQYVGEETDREVFFRWNGFLWYNACVEVFDERAAADIDMEGGPGTSILDPIHLDDIESLDDSNDDNMDDLLVEEEQEPFQEPPAPIDVYDVVDDFLHQEMEVDTDVESCVDSN